MPIRWLAAGLCAGFLSSATPLRAQGLDKAMAAADALAQKGDYAGARAALRAGIDDPSSMHDVLGRYGDVRNRMAEWAYREQHPTLQPQDVLAGTVEKWAEKKRAAELDWNWSALSDEQRLADFAPWKDDLLFRVPVGANFTVQMEGKWPEKLEPVSFLIGVNKERSGGWRITPGFHRSKVKPDLLMPRRAERFGETREMLEASSEGLDEPGTGYSYTLEVRNGQITLKTGSKKLATWKTAHADLLPGSVGFHAPGLTRFHLEGELEKTAWDARQSTRQTQLLETFRNRNYDLAVDMPAWFGGALAQCAGASEFRAPGDAPAAAVSTWGQLQAQPDGFDFPTWSKNAGLAEPAAFYAEALSLAARGAWKDCVAKATLALNGGLRIGPVMALRARAQFYSGHGELPIKDLQAQLDKFPDDCGMELAHITGCAYGPKAMLSALDRAIAAGALSPRVLHTRDQLAAALAGPAGPDSYRYEDAPNKVLVLSDGDATAASKVAKAVFNAREGCVSVVTGVFTAKEAMTVLHFTSDGARAAFCARVGLDPKTTGYVPALRLSLFAGDPDRAVDLEKLNRMVWLQHLDGTLDVTTAPEWFVRGHEAFFAASSFDSGRLDYFPNVTMAKRAREVPPALRPTPGQLMQMSSAEWNKNRERNEAEAWILVHFMNRNVVPPYEGRMASYFQSLARGEDRATAYQTAFGDLPVEPFNEAVALHRKAQVEKVQ